MDEHGGTRAQLGACIRQRRTELGLSVREASRRAGIDRGTWGTAESGTRVVHAHNAAAIERVLDWPPGSVDEILAGEKVPATTGDRATVASSATMDDPHARRILAVMRRIIAIPDDELPPDEKVDLIHSVLRNRAAAVEVADEASNKIITARVGAWRRQPQRE